MSIGESLGNTKVQFGGQRGRTTTNDAKQFDVYSAEGKLNLTQEQKQRITLPEANTFVKNVLTDGLWKKARRFAPKQPMPRPAAIMVAAHKHDQFSGAIGVSWSRKKKISLNKGATGFHGGIVNDGMTKYTLLHELAHQSGYPSHGRGFRLMQVLLLAKFLNLGIARKLHKLYTSSGLSVALSDVPKPLPWKKWVDRQMVRLAKHTDMWAIGKEEEVKAANAIASAVKEGHFVLTGADMQDIREKTSATFMDGPDGQFTASLDLG